MDGSGDFQPFPSSKDWVHHPIETTIYKWLALGFQVPVNQLGSSTGLDHAHVDVEREPFAVAVGDTQWIHEMCQYGQKDGMIVIYSKAMKSWTPGLYYVSFVCCVLCVFGTKFRETHRLVVGALSQELHH